MLLKQNESRCGVFCYTCIVRGTKKNTFRKIRVDGDTYVLQILKSFNIGRKHYFFNFFRLFTVLAKILKNKTFRKNNVRRRNIVSLVVINRCEYEKMLDDKGVNTRIIICK